MVVHNQTIPCNASHKTTARLNFPHRRLAFGVNGMAPPEAKPHLKKTNAKTLAPSKKTDHSVETSTKVSGNFH